jgi:RNA polymerase sigma factor (sigma-70 family)
VDSTHGKDFVLTNYARNLIQIKARQLCRRREFLPSDQADLQQELWLMLCERADAFDPAKASLDTFIDRVVNTAVGVILRNRQRLKRNTGGPVVSLDDSGNDPARPNSMAHGLSPEHLARRTGREPTDPFTEQETAEAVEFALARMPDDLQEIARRLMSGTVNSVSQEMNISRRAVRKAGLAIREFLERAGFGIG